jgi:hypothetical protein
MVSRLPLPQSGGLKTLLPPGNSGKFFKTAPLQQERAAERRKSPNAGLCRVMKWERAALKKSGRASVLSLGFGEAGCAVDFFEFFQMHPAISGRFDCAKIRSDIRI